ncbi:MAG: hypothetical protein ACPGXK_13635 [Phycisphaerae bacterium]
MSANRLANRLCFVTRSRFKNAPPFLLLVAAIAGLSGCQTQDPAEGFVQYMNSLPEEERLPEWDKTYQLMSRPAPQAGDIAPDFTLDTYDGSRAVTRSRIQGDRPMVLIFGSYT